MSLCSECPACGADLRAAPIPAASLHLYGYGRKATCDGCGQPAHFSRLIGVYDERRDRTDHWRCPDCGHVTPRFP